jgi:tetratricopeptide (TPR) repeat protein
LFLITKQIHGIVLDNLGNHTAAIEYYDKALAIDPKSLTDKAVALDRLGNHAEALEYINNNQKNIIRR